MCREEVQLPGWFLVCIMTPFQLHKLYIASNGGMYVNVELLITDVVMFVP
jgi:hypothetical protein